MIWGPDGLIKFYAISRMEVDSSALGIAGIVSGLVSILYTYMKHSSCHGNCCGKKMDMEIDLTPVVKINSDQEKKDNIV